MLNINITLRTWACSLATSAGFLLLSSVQGVAQSDFKAYQIYDAKGKMVSLSDVVKKATEVQVVLFGELHNDPIVHWLQLKFIQELDQSDSLVLAAEMFESDDQVVLDEYLAGRITEDHFKKEAKLWNNYSTDYKPLVEYAKANNLKFIASNVPRRYASIVSREGQQALLTMDGAMRFLPALPFEVTPDDKGYEEMKSMMGHGHGAGMDIDKMIEAQALKDYTMAANVGKFIDPSVVVVHFNGSFHSNYRAGICNYLKAQHKEAKLLVIASTMAEEVDFKDEWKGLADYIIVSPEDMTKTY